MAILNTDNPPETGVGLKILEEVVTRYRDAILLIARLAMAYVFVESGLHHVVDLSGFAERFGGFQLPASWGVPLAMLASLVELLCGVALAMGYRLRETSIVMIGFVVVTIFIGHRFWEFEGIVRRQHIVQIKKNIAIIGGILAFMANGGGRYTLSVWLAERKS